MLWMGGSAAGFSLLSLSHRLEFEACGGSNCPPGAVALGLASLRLWINPRAQGRRCRAPPETLIQPWANNLSLCLKLWLKAFFSCCRLSPQGGHSEMDARLGLKPLA